MSVRLSSGARKAHHRISVGPRFADELGPIDVSRFGERPALYNAVRISSKTQAKAAAILDAYLNCMTNRRPMSRAFRIVLVMIANDAVWLGGIDL